MKSTCHIFIYTYAYLDSLAVQLSPFHLVGQMERVDLSRATQVLYSSEC
jgi:hypothetical protein